MRPETPSTVFARDAMRSPSALKASAERRQIAASSRNEPRKGTPNASAPNPSSVTTSRIRKKSRENRNESRYSLRDIGVAMKRLRRRLLRESTMANPIPHTPLPMRFIPSRPGMTKSI